MTRLDPPFVADLSDPVQPGAAPDPLSHAIVIGAGLGGLASAMRLGAKGYRVTVVAPVLPA